METVKVPYRFVDEVTPEDILIGWSLINDINGKHWGIKRIWKEGNEWKMGFPNGSQDNVFVWDKRNEYTYY